MVQKTNGMAAFHLAADGILSLNVIDSILAHGKPLAFDFDFYVPRTLVPGVTDLALQTTCRPKKTVRKAVRTRHKTSSMHHIHLFVTKEAVGMFR